MQNTDGVWSLQMLPTLGSQFVFIANFEVKVLLTLYRSITYYTVFRELPE
ncbi:hypothetical protein ACFQZJ_11170 [Maribacter chungangensis]|uniref:Uncharacterized protein n=1 Tax=Maribacter chungangensis TaxID=1069117 RepID=A0ABW3B3Y4_9FLAO